METHLNAVDLEIITQLMDAAAQRGLDLKSVRLGDVTVEFSRPVADPPNPYALPTLPYRPFGEEVGTPGVITAPVRRPQAGIQSEVLWTNGKPPSFPG